MFSKHPAEQSDFEPLQADGDWQWLRTAPIKVASEDRINVVDLFSGCGAMSLGLAEAARRHGRQLGRVVGVEADASAAGVFERNLNARVLRGDVRRVFQGRVGAPISPRERALNRHVGTLDFLLGGPPCQGHSDLNNHTRRSDPKNALYLVMARAAEVLQPAAIVIENVPPVMWDSKGVVAETRQALEDLGYEVEGGVVNAIAAGVPQARRRYVLVGLRQGGAHPKAIFDSFRSPVVVRTVAWAIKDLEVVNSTSPLDTASTMSAENRARAAYLIRHRLEDLPNTERPACHRDNPTHSYKSMYGRLSWTKPAQTITTGFTSMGQGRFVHPSKPRTITPHEAARLQTIPDWFEWGDASRGKVARMIGNAVPPMLMTALGTAILNGMSKAT